MQMAVPVPVLTLVLVLTPTLALMPMPMLAPGKILPVVRLQGMGLESVAVKGESKY